MHPEQARRTFSVSQAVANYALRLNCLAPLRLAVLPPKTTTTTIAAFNARQTEWDRERERERETGRRGRQTAADGHRLGL